MSGITKDDVEKMLATRLRDAAIADLGEKYELIYVDQGDRLSDDQIAAVVAGDWDKLWESNEDWESYSRHQGALYHAEDAVDLVVNRWMREEYLETTIYEELGLDAGDYPHYFRPGAQRCERCSIIGAGGDAYEEGACTGHDDWPLPDYDEFRDNFKSYDSAYDEIVDAIKERDSSDPYKQLAYASGRVLMRQVVADEDAALYGNHTPTAVIAWLQENLEPGSVLKRNQHNLKVVRSVIAESMHSLAYSMGMLVYAADVGDLYDLPADVEYVEVVNPYLYIGNYYQGDGYCSEEPLDAVIRIKRADLTTDKGAAGYGWDEVAGVYVSAYEAEVRPVVTEEVSA